MLDRIHARVLLAAALLFLPYFQPTGAADCNGGNGCSNCPGCNGCSGPCAPGCLADIKRFGYNPPIWRPWPGTEQAPQVAQPPAALPGSQIPPVEVPSPNKEFEKPAEPADTAAQSAPGDMPPNGFPPPQGNGNPNGNIPGGANPGGALPPPPKQPGPNPSGAQKLNQIAPGQNMGPLAGPWMGSQNVATLGGPARVPENILRTPAVEAAVQWSNGTTSFPPASGAELIAPSASPASANRPAGFINPERNHPPAADGTVDQASYSQADMNFNSGAPRANICRPATWQAGTEVSGPMLIPASDEAFGETPRPSPAAGGPALIPAGAGAMCETPVLAPIESHGQQETTLTLEPIRSAPVAVQAEPCRPAAIPEKAAVPENVERFGPVAGNGSVAAPESARQLAPVHEFAPPAGWVPPPASASSPAANNQPAAETIHVDVRSPAPTEASPESCHRPQEAVAPPISFSPLRDAFPKFHLACEEHARSEAPAGDPRGREQKAAAAPQSAPAPQSQPTAAAIPVVSWSPLRDAFPKTKTHSDCGDAGDISGINPLEIEASMATEGVPSTRTPPASNPLSKESIAGIDQQPASQPMPTGRLSDGQVHPAGWQQADAPAPAKLSDINPLEVIRSQGAAPAAPIAPGR